jgi:hypothetical protein
MSGTHCPKRLCTATLLLAALGNAAVVMAAEGDPSSWTPSGDAVVAAPMNHRVLYEDEAIRVLRVGVRVGERENPHHHRWPSVMVIDSLCKFVDYDGNGNEIKFPIPEKLELPLVLRLPPQPLHGVQNTGDTACAAVRVEFKKP